MPGPLAKAGVGWGRHKHLVGFLQNLPRIRYLRIVINACRGAHWAVRRDQLGVVDMGVVQLA